MKESIGELQSVIRRVRPHLLLLHQQDNPTAAAVNNGSANNHNNNDDEVFLAVRNELQQEAASELVNAIAAFVWKLDCLWDELWQRDYNNGDDYIATTAIGAIGNVMTANKNHPGRHNSRSSSHEEPYTEWNEDAKALVREGYGMILSSVSQSLSLSSSQHEETMRSLTRSSILDLLTSVSTSACRHFLIAFLPHFMPLALIEEKSPSVETTKRSNSSSGDSRSDLPAVISQLLETFQSLIRTDATTLVPFLSTLSNLFGNESSWDEKGMNVDINIQMSGDDDESEDNSHTNNKTPREECFHICISSMSSISEHDLPSLLKSLFTLVRSEEEGRLAMESVRREFNSVCGNAITTTAIPDPSILGLSPIRKNDDNDLPMNDRNDNNNNDLVLFIGNVIIQFLLSDDKLYRSKHLAKGYLDAVRHSIHTQTQLHDSEAQTSSTILLLPDISDKSSLSCLTTLDAIILISLHSHDEYQPLVKSIVNSLTTYQALLLFRMIQPLIESWGNGTHHHNPSLLYGPLASSLISLLFYMLMVSTTMTIPSQAGNLQFNLVDGLLSFHHTKEEAVAAANRTIKTRESNNMMTYAITCCRVISNLHLTLDPQKQQQVVDSLLSMVTDSFVRSGTASSFDFSANASSHSLLAGSCAACRTLLLISTTHATSLSQIKGTVMDRLLLLASMSGEKADNTISYHLFDMNCAIIISLLNDNEQQRTPINGNVASELLILCQKFLFATSCRFSKDKNNNSHHRVICGIILASRLLRCKLILRSERGSIWNWVMSVITPATNTTTPILALNPVVAQWGLSFLEFASSSVKHNSFHPEITEFVDTNPVCSHSDVFNQVNKMLATAAIIQMEDSLRIPLGDESSNNTFLAYSHGPQKKTAETNCPMVICSPYFLYGTKCDDPEESKPSFSTIHHVSDYVYDLVDRYLQLGRLRSSGALMKSSWNPRGWLLTKVQLPCCLSQSSMDLIGMKNKYLELEDEPKSTNGDVNPENWKRLFSPEVSKSALVRNLKEFVSCIILSISVSCAVLKHAHDHFLHEEVQLAELCEIGSDDAKKMTKKKQKQVEALRKLLQFQIGKVMSMQRVCRNIYQALNGLYLAAYKQRPSGSTEKMLMVQNDVNFYDERRILLAEIKESIIAVEAFLNSRMNRFDSPVLWSCMLDVVDDSFLLETMTKTFSMDETSSLRWQHIIHFRMHILHHLQQNLTSNNENRRLHVRGLGTTYSTPFDDVTLRGLSRVFQLLTLTPCLSSCNFIENFNEDGRMYLSALYKILLAAFSLAASSTRIGPTMIHNALIVDVVKNRRRKKAIKLDVRVDRNPQLDHLIQRCAAFAQESTVAIDSVDKLKEGFIQQLLKCEDASFSCYIIDLISILVTSKEFSRGAMVEITWKNLHSVYTSSSSIAHLPYMLVETNHIISEVTENEQCDAERVGVVKDSFSHLLRLSSALFKTKDLHSKAFYHSLLAHFSSLLIERVSQSQCVTKIYKALEATITFASEGQKRDPSKSLPGLNEKNLPSVFELLLHMNALSLALAKPFSSKKHLSLRAYKMHGPYCEIMWPIEMFGKLLLLFKTNHHSFARRVFVNVVKNSLLMIKLCDYQLQYCVDWRSSQNLSLVGSGFQDYAAAELLQPLIDCIASDCIGEIISFCRSIKNDLSESNFKNTKSIAGLIFRCQGIKETLQNICQTQSLKFPEKISPSDASLCKRGIHINDTAPEKKRRRTNTDSPQKRSNSRLLSSASVLEQLPTLASERPFLTKSSSESEESEMSDDRSFANSDEDTFGAFGDWGAVSDEERT